MMKIFWDHMLKNDFGNHPLILWFFGISSVFSSLVVFIHLRACRKALLMWSLKFSNLHLQFSFDCSGWKYLLLLSATYLCTLVEIFLQHLTFAHFNFFHQTLLTGPMFSQICFFERFPLFTNFDPLLVEYELNSWQTRRNRTDVFMVLSPQFLLPIQSLLMLTVVWKIYIYTSIT